MPPCCTCCGPALEEKLKAFVDRGGVLIGTYHTGLVNENDLCYLGGWPGAGLMELFGVWHEGHRRPLG